MPRPALYSSSRPTRRPAEPVAAVASAPQPSPPLAPPAEASETTVAPRNHLRALWATVVLLTALLLASVWLHPGTTPRRITQDDIDAAVLRTLETTTFPSPATAAVEAVAPSVVRVASYTRSKNGKKELERGIGTGVVWVFSAVLLQILIPDRLRGRVFAFEFAAFTLTQSISTLWAGYAYDNLGWSVSQIFFSAAVVSIVITGVWLIFYLRVRSRPRFAT